MIAFDTTFLTLMLFPGAKHPIDNARQRIEFLISDIHGSGEAILVPTPAFCEVLVKSGNARADIIGVLTKSSKFLLAPFDTRCALELSLMMDAALTTRDKRGGAEGTWVKVKFHRQIIAITKTFGGRAIYSEDEGLRKTALSVSDIQIPEKDQGKFWT
jgi:hypothetical protein